MFARDQLSYHNIQWSPHCKWDLDMPWIDSKGFLTVRIPHKSTQIRVVSLPRSRQEEVIWKMMFDFRHGKGNLVLEEDIVTTLKVFTPRMKIKNSQLRKVVEFALEHDELPDKIPAPLIARKRKDSSEPSESSELSGVSEISESGESIGTNTAEEVMSGKIPTLIEKANANASIGEDTNAAVGEDTNAAVVEDTNAAVGEDTNAAIVEDINGAIGEDTNIAVGEDSNVAEEAVGEKTTFTENKIAENTNVEAYVDESEQNRNVQQIEKDIEIITHVYGEKVREYLDILDSIKDKENEYKTLFDEVKRLQEQKKILLLSRDEIKPIFQEMIGDALKATFNVEFNSVNKHEDDRFVDSDI